VRIPIARAIDLLAARGDAQQTGASK